MKIPMVRADQLQHVVAIIGSDGMKEDEMEAGVVELVADSTMARRLIDWIPEVFGLVLVSHIGKVNLPKTFTAKASNGRWLEISLEAEPIFGATLPIAMAMFHSGPRNVFRNIAERSAVLSAANRLLNAGSSIEGATLSGPALIGIPADIYASKPESFWRRLFR